MSLLTRCPACTTLYRVVPDQLRISEGWVKCGQCGDIFDASQHLIEATIDPDPPSRAEVDVPSTADFQDAQDLENDVLVPGPLDAFDAGLNDQSLPLNSTPELDLGPEIPKQADVDVDLAFAGPPDVVVDVVSQTSGPSPFSENDTESPYEFERQPEPRQVRWDDDAPKENASVSSSDNDLPGAVQLTFLQADKRQAFWRKPMVRVALVIMSFVLGLSLLGQWVYQERDRLAAQWPDLRPMLLVFCGLANCEVQPLKRIEALSVDSVGFHQLSKETYRLTFTVKNASTLPLAFPAVELALTDAQDMPVYRQVFSSKDLGAAEAEIAAGADWSAVVALRMNSAALAPRVLGYRLLVFYP